GGSGAGRPHGPRRGRRADADRAGGHRPGDRRSPQDGRRGLRSSHRRLSAANRRRVEDRGECGRGGAAAPDVAADPRPQAGNTAAAGRDGGDFTQRRKFVHDSTDGMAVDAVLEIVQAAAESSHQTISHSLVRMLSKLAAHAEGGAPQVRPQADAALRDQVRRLLEGWTLADPNPDAYGAALQRMARAAPDRAVTPEGEHATEPDRIVAMALEVDAVNAHVLAAADRVVQAGRLDRLLDALAEVSESPGAAREVWARLATADVVRQLATQDPVDFKTLERLVPRVGVAAAAPLLDALAAAEARGVRRGLLAQLAKMGPEIAAIVVQRLEDARWYVTRNMLALLEELSPLPAGFSAAAYLGHPDARVRWQAVKVQVKLPDERDEAL